jgi:hypothetical protein
LSVFQAARFNLLFSTARFRRLPDRPFLQFLIVFVTASSSSRPSASARALISAAELSLLLLALFQN